MKRVSLFILCLSAILGVVIYNIVNQPKWEGNWIFGRYYFHLAGSLEITNCKNNKCKFDISTMNGAHSCHLDGEMEIKGLTASYYEKIDEEDSDDFIKVDMTLHPEKQRIEVTCDGRCNYYCGMRAWFDGYYEDDNAPLRYQTTFDCWSNSLSEAEKLICASPKLSQADIELGEVYQASATTRNDIIKQCGAEEKCLWNQYVEAIKKEYEKKTSLSLNFYDYMKLKIENDERFSPDDFSVLKDYFLNNMEKEDYDAWKVTLAYKNLDDYEGYIFETYGVAGLYTIYESAFYLSEEEMWLAFLPTNLKDDKHIVVYTYLGKEEQDMPQDMREWIDEHQSDIDKNIVLKYFNKK